MKIKRVISAILIAAVIAGIAGCAANTDDSVTSSDETSLEPATTRSDAYLEDYATFEVTSPDVVDGVWLDVISATELGENSSPELSWEAVEGAEEYVIYMIDRDSMGFLIWKSGGIKETSIPRGYDHEYTNYHGPHVGHGWTHTYDVYVIALRAPVERLKGGINAINARMEEYIMDLDTDVDGNTGNIIAYGKVSGTFTDCRFRDVEPSGAYIM